MARTHKIWWRCLLLAAASFIIAAFMCNYNGDKWEESIRTALYTITNDSIPQYSKEIMDNNGVPYVHYADQNGVKGGYHYNPTIIANTAIEHYQKIKQKDTASKASFINSINWLAQNITYKDGYGIYVFNWQQPWYPAVGSPYTSAMSSGRAIEAFTYAYQLTNDNRYLGHAAALLKGFYLPIEKGGFTYHTNNGWWYEEFADTSLNTPRILDGHSFATLGVYEYWLATKSDSARQVFDKGIEALKHHLPSYDNGKGWSYYDIHKNPTDKKYHRIVTAQMKQLAEITGDPAFNKYYNAWNASLTKPYLLRVIGEKNRSGIILVLLTSLAIFTLLFIISFTWRRTCG